MTLRYSIRSAMFLTALVACGCGWYAWNAAERQREIATLDDLKRVVEHGIIIADGGHPYDGCGTWSGAMAHIEFRGPEFLRKLNPNAFKRVVRIEVQDEQNPEIIAVVERFNHLEELLLETTESDAENKVALRETGYLNAIRRFQSSHPKIDVQVWNWD